MCDKCMDIILRKQFYSYKDYINCLSYISELLQTGNYRILEQTCPLDKVKRLDGCWIDDIINHKIQCIHCGELFLAWADTYHGNGGFIKEDERFKYAKDGSLFDL